MINARIMGLIFLHLSLVAHHLMNINGFWIGTTTGVGAGLLIIGKIKKFSN